ncbi:MAG: presqualene diphosphate synthase HpnD [Ignavibacteriaceae bacterium]|nr:presqualene diphosphate synthase HpnD [Ignavibacteriaceae bacterium]
MSQELAQQISKKSKSSFYYAFNLLPAPKREAMTAVYAFCRETDDIADEGNEPEEVKVNQLTKWRFEFEKAIESESNYPLLNTVGKAIKQFNIPVTHFFELIKGVEMDLSIDRYETFEDLKLYCYRVASTVGLICIEIFGYKHKTAIKFAENLGLALQLTNIIRDVSKDAKKGRIYLPLEDLKRFNYSEEELFAGVYNNNFIKMMEFQTARAKKYFDLATENLNVDDKKAMFAARAMQHIYYRILEKIIKKNYDIFSEKIKVSSFEKIGISVGVWAKYSFMYK